MSGTHPVTLIKQRQGVFTTGQRKHPVNRLNQVQKALTASVFRQRCVRNVLQLPAKKFRGENFPLTPFAHSVRQTSVYLPKLSFSATARLNTGCAGA